MAKLEGQSIAASYDQLLHVDRDGGGNTTTHVSVKDGDNDTTFALTLATDAVMITSTNRLEFGDNGTYIHQSADGVLDLVSDTELELNATTIDINGAVDISGDTTIAGDVIMADGKGIDFQNDASPSAGMTAEILDDYETGTWDAVVTDGTNPMTMTLDTGYYTKVGNLVTVSGYFTTSSVGSASGSIRITGLPFTIANNAAAYSGGNVTDATGFAITAGESVGYYGAINGTHIVLKVWDSTVGTTEMQASEWTADGAVSLGFSYRAA